jgi:hypothetical protein
MKFIPIVLIIAAMSLCTVASAKPVNSKNMDQKNETVMEVTGYYKASLGDTAKWNPISLKVKSKKALSGETYEVVGYKLPLAFMWIDLYNACSVSKVLGDLSDQYAFSTHVDGYTVYFNYGC